MDADAATPVPCGRAAGGGARDSLRGWAATPSWGIVYIIGVWRVSEANISCKSKKLKPTAARGQARRARAGGGGVQAADAARWSLR